jgi:hypothetical protein
MRTDLFHKRIELLQLIPFRTKSRQTRQRSLRPDWTRTAPSTSTLPRSVGMRSMRRKRSSSARSVSPRTIRRDSRVTASARAGRCVPTKRSDRSPHCARWARSPGPNPPAPSRIPRMWGTEKLDHCPRASRFWGTLRALGLCNLPRFSR